MPAMIRSTVVVLALLLLAGCSGPADQPPATQQQSGDPTAAGARAMPAVGEPAPDFTLPDQQRNPVTLSDFRGTSNVVLAFYVLAFTGG